MTEWVRNQQTGQWGYTYTEPGSDEKKVMPIEGEPPFTNPDNLAHQIELGIGSASGDLWRNIAEFTGNENLLEYTEPLTGPDPYIGPGGTASRIGTMAVGPSARGRLFGYPMDAAYSIMTGNPDDPVWKRAVEGLVGRELGEGFMRMSDRLRRLLETPNAQVNPDVRAETLSEVFEREGGRLTPGQRTGYSPYKRYETGIESTENADLLDEYILHNRKIWNQRAAEAIGGSPERDFGNFGYADWEDIRAATNAEFDALEQRIGGIEIELPGQLRGEIEELGLTKEMRYVLENRHGVMFGPDGELPRTIDGQAYKRLRENILEGWVDGDRNQVETSMILIEKLDDAAATEIPAAEMTEYARIRDDWRSQDVLGNPAYYEPGGGLKPQQRIWSRLSAPKNDTIQRPAFHRLREFARAYLDPGMNIEKNPPRSGTVMRQSVRGRIESAMQRKANERYFSGDDTAFRRWAASGQADPWPVRAAGRNLGRSIMLQPGADVPYTEQWKEYTR